MGRIGQLARHVCAVLVCAALSAGAARADEYARLFERLLVTPDDPALNMRYAALAETRGERRLALAAYERALARDPGNRQILRAYKRLKRLLLPNVTALRIETGGSYASNPGQRASSERRRKSDWTWDALLYLFDERTLGRHRWRTEGFARTQLQGRVKELDDGEVTVWTGPVFELAPDRRLHVAAGGGYAALDDRRLYSEATARLTYEWLHKGVDQAVKARVGYREMKSRFAGDGVVANITGHFTVLPKLVRGDALYIQPRFRYHRPSDAIPRRDLFGSPVSDTFAEAGNRLAYYVPLRAGKVYLGGGFGAYYRDYDQKVVPSHGEGPRNAQREDLYLEPTAHLVLPHLFGSNYDLRVDYRFENNDSNDRLEEFENHVVGFRGVRRF